MSAPTRKITLELTLDGNSLTMFSRRIVESTTLAALAPLAVAELIQAWIDECHADDGFEMTADPLRDHEIRNAQWNALRQGRRVPTYAEARINLAKVRPAAGQAQSSDAASLK